MRWITSPFAAPVRQSRSSGATRPAQHILCATQGDRTVLLDPHRGRYYSLDGSGARIWALLVDGHSPTEIEARIASEYGVPRARIATDLHALLEALRTRGLVR